MLKEEILDNDILTKMRNLRDINCNAKNSYLNTVIIILTLHFHTFHANHDFLLSSLITILTNILGIQHTILVNRKRNSEFRILEHKP